MAIYENPKHYKGPALQRITARAKDSQTWQAGQFCRRTASGVVKCLTQATSIHGLFATTQATSTSSSDVEIELIPSTETKFVIYATASTADDIANTAYIGKNCGLGVNSSICSVSTSNQTDAKAALLIEDLYVAKDKYGTTTSASPGAYIVSVRSAFLSQAGL